MAFFSSMPCPSGPISMSMINTVLGRASNTANSSLAGGTTPAVGSQFWLGGQSGSLNQTAPHAMSEWYCYNVSTTTTTTSTTTTTTTAACPPFGTFIRQECLPEVACPINGLYDVFADGACGEYITWTGLCC